MEEKEQRIRQITNFYYSNSEVQQAIFNFSKNREVVPRYFEGFGKRPDSLEYPGDVFELVKKGATSFHCSEELWKDPLEIATGMKEEELNSLRNGWDLLLDIDSKYLDYSKILAELIINLFKFHRIKNYGIKFSGSKGFHIIVPWKAFPKTIYNEKTKDRFPEIPRILTKYIMEMTKKELIRKITDLTKPNKYVRDFQAPKEVMPDLILVSPRHLFRAPYSLHEKTRLASVVIKPSELKEFQPKDANPLKIKVRNFLYDAEEGEASELLREALDWHKNLHPEEKKSEIKLGFKPIKLTELSVKLSESHFPPTIQKILKGVKDGRKRSLFVLLNLFRSLNLDKDEIEKRIFDWNKKNELPLNLGYIKSQLDWSYRNKIVPPPNYGKGYYKGLGLTPTEEEIRYKNPSNYTIKKVMQESNKTKGNAERKK